MENIVLPTVKTTNKDIQLFLKNLGVPYSYKTKEKLMQKIGLFDDLIKFPWRVDQKEVIESFIDQKYKYYVVNGIFGCGKTTMLMGIHVISILKNIYKPSEAMFVSFNVSIRNELKQKLKKYGMSSTTKVRTFDSLIYEICKLYKYPHLDLPNYDGKRKFVYGICKKILCKELEQIKLSNQPEYVFIDECQDLEVQTMILFKTFFSECQVIFTGDVFQSIQKEPKESLLWHLLENTDLSITSETISKHYMKETPRIPENILKNVKKSLQNYYPEFSSEIEEWKSSSSVLDTKIEWKQFNTYTNVFTDIDSFLNKYPLDKCMILTFSSAITVKGAMGDLARIRRYLVGRGIDVNKNHKKMDYDKLFLSTANSSKGLERDYVLLVSTFPLEKAFINFSNDLVMNLITVGITRAKQKVVFLVPAYKDKYSTSLQNFVNCPEPKKEKIRDDKCLNEFQFMDYYKMEHCVTEIIRQGIVKYDTRIELQKYVKKFHSTSIFEKNIPVPKIDTEEERAFVGVLIENLITSSWSHTWPKIDDIEKFRNHPMYFHCFKKIEKLFNAYNSFIAKNRNISFEGIYMYSQIHLGMFNKIFIDIRPESKLKLQEYWNVLKYQVEHLKPEGNIKIQSNLKMPFATGICDVLISRKDDSKEEVTIWELKASIDHDWKENALFQAMLYAIMTGKNACRLVILNPFRNEKCSYFFNMKTIMHLRESVISDILCWNINCFLAKNIKCKGNTLKVTDNYFLYMKENQDKTKFSQITLLYFKSPTKIETIFNMHIHDDVLKDEKRTKMNRDEKLSNDSKIDEQTALTILYDYLHSAECTKSKVYYGGDCSLPREESKYVSIKELIGDMDLDKVLKLTEEEYESMPNSAFSQTISHISLLSVIFKLI